MPTIQVFNPCDTIVEINELRDKGCDNFVGKVVAVKVECCCGSTANTQPCAKYLVRHMFGSCHSCMHVETWYCPEDLTEVTAAP